MIINILLTILLVLANAFCVAAEFAIVKVRQSQLKVRAKQGSRLAIFAEDIVHNLDSYLSATQVGVTLVSLGLGWIGEPVVSKIIINFLQLLHIELSPQIASPIAFFSISFLHIVFGELAPKSLAILYAESITIGLSIPLKILHFIFKPFIVLLNGSANLVLKIFRITPPKESDTFHTPDEIRYILEESTKSGALEDTEHTLLENVFDFADTPVKQIMSPRNNIEAVEKHSHIDSILETFIEKGYSRIPVFDKGIDNIIGVIYGKDLLTWTKHPNLIILEDILRKPIFVNEDDMIHNVLKRMQKTHIQLAIVINEFGGTAGLITIEDILEEIVGEIQDEHDEEVDLIETKTEGIWEVSAALPIDDVNDFLIEELPDSENYETIGGYVLSAIGRIPIENEIITIGNSIFTILEASERKIEKIRIEQKTNAENQIDNNN
jgi:CBS domain containing-hemolysin-like protein